jgi:hypothetical protein
MQCNPPVYARSELEKELASVSSAVEKVHDLADILILVSEEIEDEYKRLCSGSGDHVCKLIEVFSANFSRTILPMLYSFDHALKYLLQKKLNLCSEETARHLGFKPIDTGLEIGVAVLAETQRPALIYIDYAENKVTYTEKQQHQTT